MALRAGVVAVVGMSAMAALALSTLAVAAAFPALLRVPPRDSAGPPRALPSALFSHRAHQSFGCYACHPSVFPQAPLGFTHQEMRRGQFCGRCHDGQVTFAIEGALCTGCHASSP
ncbi:MAG: cytochrome c3 family protein [Myxococcales bacterium]